jgi:hypothetical protein
MKFPFEYCVHSFDSIKKVYIYIFHLPHCNADCFAFSLNQQKNLKYRKTVDVHTYMWDIKVVPGFFPNLMLLMLYFCDLIQF